MDNSQWRIRPKFIGMLITLVLLGVLLSLFLPVVSYSGRPGNNRNALSKCRLYLDAARSLSPNETDFDLSKLFEPDRKKLANLPRTLPFLIKTNFVWRTNGGEIVIVCPYSYSDIPPPSLFNLFRKSRAHAVGYSDGRTSLISPQQFTNLDLRSFVSLAYLKTNFASQSVSNFSNSKENP